METRGISVVYRVGNPDGIERHFTENAEQAELARSNGYDIHEYIHAEVPVYQERRYQFIGKKQLEYWADVDRGAFQYLPKSERRIIYIIKDED